MRGPAGRRDGQRCRASGLGVRPGPGMRCPALPAGGRLPAPGPSGRTRWKAPPGEDVSPPLIMDTAGSPHGVSRAPTSLKTPPFRWSPQAETPTCRGCYHPEFTAPQKFTVTVRSWVSSRTRLTDSCQTVASRSRRKGTAPPLTAERGDCRFGWEDGCLQLRDL